MVLGLEKAEVPDESQHSSSSADQVVENGREGSISPHRDSDSIHSHSSENSIRPVPEKEEIVQRTKSRSSSTRSRTINVIPRLERRGLLGNIAIIPEVDQPKHYKNSTKWLITLIVAISATAAPLGSAIFFPALAQLSADFNITPTIANLTVALYMLSMSIFPLWWSSFSETLGRRTIYLVSFSLFTIWNVGAALSTSIGMLIIMRMLGGGAAASVQAVGAGTIADIWEPKERGRAMGIFYLGPLMGPLLAPVVGGALAQKWGWKSTQWFQVIYGGVLFIILTSCLPETLERTKPRVPQQEVSDGNMTDRQTLTRISTTRSVKNKTRKLAKIFKRCIIDPLAVLGYLRFPPVLITVYLASCAFACLYVLNVSIQKTFGEAPYSFSVLIVGLLYIPGSLGYLIASLFGGKWSDKIMHREARAAGRYDDNGKLLLQPEDRLRENAWLGAIIFPGALIWYGWTAEKHIYWIVPIIANFFFGTGSMIIFSTSTTMLTEFLSKKSSSGVAVNNFVRNIFSCVGGIVASPIISAIGNGWIFTILGIWAWISAAGVIWSMKKFGLKWRADMNQNLKYV
ncbi:MFS multidrug transporter-like protein [Calycina marina]|uniref:MFS multidrug transporter-like protein n=1 Tax=Calycina marina TaxID=1763456 RepID=A0A9P7Z194_9HELO|nr:MFS multidrug transporter-like protein [Calycina marina]